MGIKKLNVKRILFFFLFSTALLGGSFSARGQLVEFAPIHQFKNPNSSKRTNLRVSQTNSLPFWEDFSSGIDTTIWEAEGVSFSETIGINPPSIGMAIFNGVDQSGRPYSLQQRDQGESDYLTSKPFDLSTLTSTESNSLFLSFFWQAGGKAEYPDFADELILQVFTPEGIWLTAWNQAGGDNLDRENFTQEMVQILPEWQHSEFRFRFFSTGRQSGPFDSWLVDYIFLNSNRSTNDLFTLDRALTRPNQVYYNNYSAYPFFLLPSEQDGAWSQVSNEFKNLENRFRAMEYSIVVSDSSGNSLTSINANTPFDPVPNTLERREFLSRDFETITLPEEETDLVFTTYLTSGDQVFTQINAGDTLRFDQVDFAVNDTVRSLFPIRDFFAYDRGQADYAAGINQRSGSIAVKYATPEEVYLKGISILFTNPSQANQPIDINVWDELGNRTIFTRQTVIPEFSSGETFTYFPLDTNLVVNGEFYVGFTQFTNNFIQIGLDKSQDQGAQVFYNVGGGWAQNEEVQGALMIRPHVANNPVVDESELPAGNLRLYPNPVFDELHIDGEVQSVQVFDSFGREIIIERQKSEKGEIIKFGYRLPGIYLVRVLTPGGVQSHRIVIRN